MELSQKCHCKSLNGVRMTLAWQWWEFSHLGMYTYKTLKSVLFLLGHSCIGCKFTHTLAKQNLQQHLELSVYSTNGLLHKWTHSRPFMFRLSFPEYICRMSSFIGNSYRVWLFEQSCLGLNVTGDPKKDWRCKEEKIGRHFSQNVQIPSF